VETTLDTQPSTRKREEHLSKDGQWRSFPKVPHLLQYVSNGNYYGRIKVGGKIIRESLKTDVWTTAKLRPTDFLRACLKIPVCPLVLPLVLVLVLETP